jgi:hypothetical protein
VTFGVLNFLLNGVTLPPVSTQTGLLQTMQQPELLQQGAADSINPPVLPGGGAALRDASILEDADVHDEPPVVKPPPSVFQHPFDDLEGIYKLPAQDVSPRCKQSQICDGDHTCGPDKLGCVTSAQERKQAVRKAIAWAWEGYRWVLCPCSACHNAHIASRVRAAVFKTRCPADVLSSSSSACTRTSSSC